MKNKRFTWSAHGAPWPQVYVVDWFHPQGPKIIAALPQAEDEFGSLAAEAVIRLMESTP